MFAISLVVKEVFPFLDAHSTGFRKRVNNYFHHFAFILGNEKPRKSGAIKADYRL
jgi:hypothetical protein